MEDAEVGSSNSLENYSIPLKDNSSMLSSSSINFWKLLRLAPRPFSKNGGTLIGFTVRCCQLLPTEEKPALYDRSRLESGKSFGARELESLFFRHFVYAVALMCYSILTNQLLTCGENDEEEA